MKLKLLKLACSSISFRQAQLPMHCSDRLLAVMVVSFQVAYQIEFIKN